MKRILYLTLLLLLTTKLCAQVTDDFSDGDFTSNPEWIGDTDKFVIDAEQLRSNYTPNSTSTYYLSTSSVSAYDASWEFLIELDLGTSSVNYVDVYLISDNANMNSTQNGYFVRIGDTDDEIVLSKISDGSISTLIDDDVRRVDGSSNNRFKIRVTRNTSDIFDLEVDDGNLGAFESIGTAVDSDHQVSNAFGVLIKQSTAASAINSHFFDDIHVSGSVLPDTQPPSIASASALSSTQVLLSFSEEIDEVSAENSASYTLSPSRSIASAEKQTSDKKQVMLTLDEELTNGTSYTLSIEAVSDLSDNVITAAEIEFDYVVFSEPEEGDVLINEFLVAPNDDEFVELFNNSNNIFNLENWTVQDEVGNSLTLPEYRLDPGKYVVITSESGTDSLDVTGFPLFNNSSDEVILKFSDGAMLQSISYSSFEEGKSYELINPSQLCKGIRNFAINEVGNSAGGVNENDSDVVDDEGPQVDAITVQSVDSLIIVFDEPIGEVSALEDSVLVNDQVANEAIISSDALTLYIKLSEGLKSEEEGTLSLLNFPDCLGNQQSTDTSLYIDEKAPELLSLTSISDTELVLVFQEELEAITSSDLSKFNLVGQSIDNVDETDTAQNALLIELKEALVLNSSNQLVINGLEDTLGNSVATDTSNFVFSTDVFAYEVVASNVIEIIFSEPLDTGKLSIENFWNKDQGYAAIIDKLDTNRVQVSFNEAFDEDENFRVYLFNVWGLFDLLQTPALEVYIDRQEPVLSAWEIPHPDSIFLFFSEPLNASSAVNFSHYLIEDRTPQELFLKSDTSVFLRPPFSFQSEVIYQLEIEGIEDSLGNAITNSQEYEIAFDTLAPAVLSIEQFSMEQLIVSFSEPLDSSQTIVSGIFSDGVAKNASTRFESLTEIVLDLEDSIPQTSSLSVFISGWSDLLGNSSDTIVFTVDTQSPKITSLMPISRNQVSISYNHNMSNSAEEVYSYDLMGKSSLNIERQEEGYIIELDTVLDQLKSYDLSIKSVLNSNGELLPDTIIRFQFETFLESILVEDSKKVALIFSEEIVAESFLDVSIESLPVQYQGVSLSEPSRYEVLLDQSLPENQLLAIKWDSAFIVGGPIIPAFDTVLTYDTKAPILQVVASDFFNQVRLTYSEPVSPLVSLESFNYTLLDGKSPEKVDQDSETVFRLTFDTLLAGTSYKLIVENLTDLSGNQTAFDTIDFIYQPPPLPGFHELRITEIMSDPSPTIGLPEVEYLEIWNASVDTFSMGGILFEDQSGLIPFPNVTLAPGHYIAVAEFDDEAFTYFEDFPSLTNSGESLALRTIYGDVIDSVTYSSQWISSSEKRDGGYSLELINNVSNCEGPANWEASIDNLGGTPGRPNSIASQTPDTIPPSVQRIELKDSISAILTFDEFMDTTVVSEDFYRSYYTSQQEVVIVFDSTFTPGAVEEILIESFMDCSGNVMGDTVLVVPFPREAVFGDLMITEIMPDPTPQVGLADGEYVELQNLTEEVIKLSGLSINGVALSGVLFPNAFVTLIPSALSGDEKYLNSQVLSPWIGLANAGDTLILSSEAEVLVELIYDDYWYQFEEKASGGYSLEVIDPRLICSTNENWKASTSSIGGTPGSINSVYALREDASGPTLVASQLSESSLIVTLNEPIINHRFTWDFTPELQVELDSCPVVFPYQLTFSFEDEPVRNLAYIFELSELHDCYGNTSDVIIGSFLRPETSIEEIYINEVLFDPLTGGDDFVELFNGSNDQFLDLGALFWQVDDKLLGISGRYVLPPQTYVALTENRAQLLFDYPLSQPETILEVADLPTLSNDEGRLTLVDAFGAVLDSVYYLDDFHSPLLADVEGVSLERLSIDYPATAKNNWSSASSVEGFATPGRVNSQSLGETDNSEQLSVAPRTFVPGSSNPTFSSLTTISLKNEASDRLANVWVVNGQGRIVKTIAQGILLGSDDFVTWDGTSDGGSLVPMGQYLVVVEFYGGATNTEVLKKPVTVGAEF